MTLKKEAPGNYEEVTFLKKSGIMSCSTATGRITEMLLDDAAPGSHIGLWAEPYREGIPLKVLKIQSPYSALTGEQVRYK